MTFFWLVRSIGYDFLSLAADRLIDLDLLVLLGEDRKLFLNPALLLVVGCYIILLL